MKNNLFVYTILTYTCLYYTYLYYAPNKINNADSFYIYATAIKSLVSKSFYFAAYKFYLVDIWLTSDRHLTTCYKNVYVLLYLSDCKNQEAVYAYKKISSQRGKI